MANEFEILIKYGLDATKAKEAAAELTKIKDATTATGKEGVKQEEAVAAATKKHFTSKKELNDMVKQLGHEFPILGAAGRLALNPIVAVTAGITAAFQIWKYRTDELTKSLGGIEMPDVTEDAIERTERMAGAFKKMADALQGIKDAKDATDKMIDLANAFSLAAGLVKPEDIAKGKANLARTAGSDAQAAAAANLAAAGSINPDNAAVADLKAAADESLAQIPDVRKRIEFIQRAQSRRSFGGFNPMKAYDDMVYGARYGGAASYEEGLGIEQAKLADLQANVSRYQNVNVDRARRIDLLLRGEAGMKTARGEFSAAAQSMGSVAGAAGGEFKSSVDQLATVDPLALAKAINNLATLMREGLRATDQALSDQQKANNIRTRQQ